MLKKLIFIGCVALMLIHAFPVPTIAAQKISEVPNIYSEVSRYTEYHLPTTVFAQYENGAKGKEKVQWNKSDINTSREGTYYCLGKVKGYPRQVLLVLTVYNLTKKIFTDEKYFSFSIHYGVESSNYRNLFSSFDSSNKTYKREVGKEIYTVTFELSEAEMKKIINSVKRIDLLSLPENLDEFFAKRDPSFDPEYSWSTYDAYILSVSCGGMSKSFSWNDKYNSEQQMVKDYRNLISIILTTIHSHDECKKLPNLSHE